MRDLVARFKSAAAQAASQQHFSMRDFIEDHGLGDFLDEAEERGWDALEIATKALHRFCVDDDGGFNGFYVGVLAAVEFLNETRPKPVGWPRPFRDLLDILKDRPTYSAIEGWVVTYYR